MANQDLGIIKERHFIFALVFLFTQGILINAHLIVRPAPLAARLSEDCDVRYRVRAAIKGNQFCKTATSRSCVICSSSTKG